MNGARDQFLARAGFTLDQDVGVSGGDESDMPKHTLERRAVPDDVVDWPHLMGLFVDNRQMVCHGRCVASL
jgi:hypothetical protein